MKRKITTSEGLRSKRLPFRMFAAATLSVCLLGCGNTQEDTPVGSINSSLVEGHPGAVFVQPGESRFVPSVSENDTELDEATTLYDHRYPSGFQDDGAIIVQRGRAVRFNAHLAARGDANFSNDLVCETINIPGISDGAERIAALAISDSEGDGVMVSWPKDPNGETSDAVYVCSDDGNEPQHGVVLAHQD